MLTSPSLLRLNVGYIVNQSIGYSRNIAIEIPDSFDLDDLTIKNLEGDILISRTTEGLLLQVKGYAQTRLECVYCLENFDQILKLDFVEMYTFPSHAVDGTELLLPDDLQINLAPLIREYLLLDIPISPICKPNCKGLCPVCGENLSHSTCNHEIELGDPRLSVLKTLLDDEASP